MTDLTARQVEVLRVLADGRTREAAAAELGIAYSTVRNHVTAVAERLDLERGNLLAIYTRLGWLRVPEARA